MTESKIDTNRSSCLEVRSDGETESETIDDFSQYTEANINEKRYSRTTIESRSETPVLQNIPVNIDKLNCEAIDKFNDDDKDNSEDIMVEISKKTTIKKIISRTTSVNGVPQSSEVEEFISTDTHVNESAKDNCSVLHKPHRLSNAFDLTDSTKDYFRYLNNQNSNISETINISRGSDTCKENEWPNTESKSYEVDENIIIPNNWKKTESMQDREFEKDIDDRDFLNSTLKIDPDIYDRRNSDPHVDGNNKQLKTTENSLYSVRKEPKYLKGKYRKESSVIKDSSHHSRRKSINDEPKGYDSIQKSKFYSDPSINKMKWVDPFRSYHLKYDLKDNGKSLQNWIKQKRLSLTRSDPNQRLQNSMNKNVLRSSSVIPENDMNSKYTGRKEIKEFIKKGNVKENLFQIRHPSSQKRSFNGQFYENRQEQKLKVAKPSKITISKLKEPLNHSEIISKNSGSTFPGSNSEFSYKVSQILTKYDLNMNGSSSISNQCHPAHHCRCHNQYSSAWECCKCRNVHRCFCCCSSFKCPSHMLSSFPSVRRYQSNEFLDSLVPQSRKSEPLDILKNGLGKIPRQKTEKAFQSSQCRKHSYYSSESRDSDPSVSRKEIEYLENKLKTIENRIRNIKVNEKRNILDCELDLECQCEDIKKHLDMLYKIVPSIRSHT